jgi:SAM-dependent methyltransferase
VLGFLTRRLYRTPSPDRILISCVAENREPFITEVLYLFQSLAVFGDRLARSKRIAHFIDEADAGVVEALARMGVIVKIVEPLDSRCRYANKISMLDHEEDYDVFVGLDCDVVIVSDFLSLLTPNAVMAKPVDDDPLDIRHWTTLFRHFGLSLPRKRYLTTFQRKETIPYFNSGVLVIPKRFVGSLSESWKRYVLALLDDYDRLPDIAPYAFFTDQFALALALRKERIPYVALPVEMNFPLHSPVHESFRPEKMSPYILHHHHRISSAGIEFTNYETVNNIISRINGALRSGALNMATTSSAPAKVSFDNLRFWDHRYRTDPKLGSGIGSRGESLTYKRKVLGRIVAETHPGSVLDVGCGDLEVTFGLPFGNYLGIDISPSVIDRNRQRKPDWSFQAGDFLQITVDELPESDMVICLDVLIHEPDAKRYAAAVERLVAFTKVVGVIGAYELPPRAAFSSHITSYHEPITETLKRAGAREIKVVGYYRDTSIICYKTNQGALRQ